METIDNYSKSSRNVHKLNPGEKFCLTVEEASFYFEIGAKKIRELAKMHEDDGIFIHHGVKLLVLREPFERFLTHTSEI